MSEVDLKQMAERMTESIAYGWAELASMRAALKDPECYELLGDTTEEREDRRRALEAMFDEMEDLCCAMEDVARAFGLPIEKEGRDG